MYDLLIRGRVVTPTGIVENGWLAISGGTILAVGSGDAPLARASDDYGSALIMPGAIDGQTHAGSQIGFPGMGKTTHAAVMGGVTTIVDMPYDHPIPVTTGAVLADKVAAIETHAICDVALYGTVPTTPDAAHIGELIQGGVCAFKISSFEAHPDRFPRISNSATLTLLKALEGTGLPLGLHNEDQEIVRQTTADFKAAGRTRAVDHSDSRPPVAELTATANFLELAASTAAHAHIVHISIADGFRLVDAYRERGVQATAEMCAHYLIFDADVDMPRLGGLLKVNPPIRGGEVEKLWQIMDEGHVSFVSSDHSAWEIERKTTESIFDVAAGMPGLEALLPGFFTAAAKRSGFDAAAVLTAEYLAERPARFFGLSRKGRLAPGYDADIAVLSPAAMIYDSKRNARGPGWSAYDGMEFAVTPAATFVRGQRVWDGETVGAEGQGRYVPRG
ncbi:MAG: amidohydrolase family protein [Candidatus Devosia phytovorans]|uniref:Amidohydrolase family protein n=1 Tax=Candidatus Devosia phytovorans TaxID=3121372 RepID=A0AAJ5VU19_9HYPH|nr:amidohydrolase family protein [Devosia sp.]WEK03483.1 MAG: amidohydrolase family protein [Devosia sp.]